MINHARTLLLNIDGTAVGEAPGREYVPADYKAVTLPSYLQRMYNILFGSQPDLAWKNFRLRQFMQLLHATELEEFVYSLDPRVTYDLNDTKWFDEYRGFKVKRLAGNPDVWVSFQNPFTEQVNSKLHFQWNVTIAGGDPNHSATITRVLPTPAAQTIAFPNNTATSSWLPLIGIDTNFRISNTPSPAGSRWEINAYGRPSNSLFDIWYTTKRLSEEDTIRLFGPYSSNMPEPYKTFYALWTSHLELPYSLGAFILAVIYKINGLYNE